MWLNVKFVHVKDVGAFSLHSASHSIWAYWWRTCTLFDWGMMVWWPVEVRNWGLHSSGLLCRVACSCLPTFRDSLSVSPSVCPETSANNYRSTMRTNPEEQRPQLHRGGSLISLHVKKVFSFPSVRTSSVVESSWNVMAHGDARAGKWRGNKWMEWIASKRHTTAEHRLARAVQTLHADVHS